MPGRQADDFDRAVAKYVRMMAGANNMSATTLAGCIDVSPNTFYRYWRGERTMGLGDLRAIFDVFDVSFADAEDQITRIYEAGEYTDE